MAAQVLARELNVELDRVDLSLAVSKYIGDTEKFLAALFDPKGTSLLLLDHLDAMLEQERRPNGGSPHSLILNWLLQSIEDRDGITVLTCRTRRDIDPAFLRRCHTVVNFALPAPPYRMMIWDRALRGAAPLDAGVDLGALAERFELSGGEIHNAAIRAGPPSTVRKRAGRHGAPDVRRSTGARVGRTTDGRRRRRVTPTFAVRREKGGGCGFSATSETEWKAFTGWLSLPKSRPNYLRSG